MMQYKLSGTTGLRVAELSLGALTFGTEMGWGEDKAECRRVFDACVRAGGNFIDTAHGVGHKGMPCFLVTSLG